MRLAFAQVRGLVTGYCGDTGSAAVLPQVTASRVFDFLVTSVVTTCDPGYLVGPLVTLGYSVLVTTCYRATLGNVTTPIPGLPPGLTLDTSGLVSGTPAAAGTYQFGVTCTDANGDTASALLTLTVFPQLSLTVSVLPPATEGQPYSFTITPQGGAAPYTFTEG